MSTKNLPFEGYSWPFTQHAIVLQANTIYDFLACAAEFEGEEEPGAKITALIVEQGLLTADMRDGRADAWRDYQQVLAETGLIYSTRLQPALHITGAGKMYLAGEIGFSELMTTQAFRYQYPNGYKFDVQSRLRNLLGDQADNMIDLYVKNDVAIKPGPLIARVLVALHELGEQAELSVSECLAYLLPIRRNSDWESAVSELVIARANGLKVDIHRHARRNVQDWFKFLGCTDYLDSSKGKIRLSLYGTEAVDQLKNYCDATSALDTFWTPVDHSSDSRMDWFDYFGTIPLELEATRPIETISAEYENANYVGGLDQDTDEESVEFGSTKLQLSEIRGKNDVRVSSTSNPNLDLQVTLSNIKQGILRRRVKTAAHDQIVKDLAMHLLDKGARVYEDRDSVDLLAIWPNNHETLFEVKTITKRSAQQRIRMAIGQLEEYAYRRNLETQSTPDKVLVLNAALPDHTWYKDFLTAHMDISIATKTKAGYVRELATDALTNDHWNF